MNENEKKKKIAVVTFYYKIINLGASLQAYALNRTIRELGYECETLRYQYYPEKQKVINTVIKRIKTNGLSSLKLVPVTIRRILDYKKTRTVIQLQKGRMERYSIFGDDYIPHSKTVYTNHNILDSVDDYDIFVAGSDQIWSYDRHNPNLDMFLDFVPESKTKISYAAGICKLKFDEWDKAFLQKTLSSYQGVSVREEDIRKKLSSMGIPVVRTLDPTFLLTADKWNELSPERLVEGDYIFVYLLSPTKSKHEIIQKYAKRINEKIVTLVNINGRYEPLDANFGDIQVNDCGPLQFVNYVKNARFVFTDSFHGLAFSINLSKDFFVFLKTGAKHTLGRNNRIHTLIGLTKLQDRIITEDVTTEALLTKKSIDYSPVQAILQKERNRSIKWLEDQLASGKRTVHHNVNFIANSSKCTGCGACAAVCPKECISMKSDSEGFMRPVINGDICIKCKKCISHCPVYSAPQINEQTKAFYVRTKQEDDLMNSTSGGAFSLLAKYVLTKGGVVYGAAFDSDMKVTHIRASNIKELQAIMRSKYVQSDICNCFNSVKKDLDAGLFVLFSGTPCQIAAIKKYLNRDYDNLYLVDIICHGVPSPKVWKDYIKQVEKKYGDKVVDVIFRDKLHGYSSPHFTIVFESGTVFSQPVRDDLYYRGFALDLYSRQSCEKCSFKGLNRSSDITLADFHGIKKVVKNFIDDDKGVSLLLSHSIKGDNLVSIISRNAVCVEVNPEESAKNNRMCFDSAIASKDRMLFFKENEGVIRFFRKHYKRIIIINVLMRSKSIKKFYRIVKK